MAGEFKFPEQIIPLGTGPSKQDVPNRLPINTSSRKIPFRIGEIIQGRVQQVFSQSEVAIDLPNGRFVAEVNGKFKAGDTLFFEVQGTEPSLILRIHSVFSKIKESLHPISEIIRLLNLPANKIFLAVVDNLKSTNSIIVRNDVLLLANNVNVLLAEEPREDLDFIINFVRYIDLFKLEPTIDLFRLFKSFVNFPEHSELVFKYLSDSPQIIPADLKPQFSFLSPKLRNDIPISHLLTMYSANFLRAPKNMFAFIFQMFHRAKESRFPSMFNELLQEVAKGYEAFVVFSSLSSQLRNGEIILLAPYIYLNVLKYGYVAFHRQRIRSNFERKKIVNIEEEKLFPPIPEDIGNQLDEYFAENEPQNYLGNYGNRLRKNVTIVGEKVIVNSPSGAKLSFRLSQPLQQDSPTISIVI